MKSIASAMRSKRRPFRGSTGWPAWRWRRPTADPAKPWTPSPTPASGRETGGAKPWWRSCPGAPVCGAGKWRAVPSSERFASSPIWGRPCAKPWPTPTWRCPPTWPATARWRPGRPSTPGPWPPSTRCPAGPGWPPWPWPGPSTTPPSCREPARCSSRSAPGAGTGSWGSRVLGRHGPAPAPAAAGVAGRAHRPWALGGHCWSGRGAGPPLGAVAAPMPRRLLARDRWAHGRRVGRQADGADAAPYAGGTSR